MVALHLQFVRKAVDKKSKELKCNRAHGNYSVISEIHNRKVNVLEENFMLVSGSSTKSTDLSYDG